MSQAEILGSGLASVKYPIFFQGLSRTKQKLDKKN